VIAWILVVCPVVSGTIKDRRTPTCSWIKFYQEDYTSFVEGANLPRRSPTTLLRWLKEVGVKRRRFDRYACLVCFHGREAERRRNLGKMIEGDKEKIKKFEDHQLLFRHQFEKAAEDKEIKDPKTIVFLYDYTTFHDLPTEKVSFFFFFFFFFCYSFFLNK